MLLLLECQRHGIGACGTGSGGGWRGESETASALRHLGVSFGCRHGPDGGLNLLTPFDPAFERRVGRWWRGLRVG